MHSLWNDDDRHTILTRVGNVSDSAAARWGRFTVDRMLSHLVEAMRMATGELPVAPKKLPIRFFPLKQLLVFVLPFPKGVPTAPELLAGAPAAVPALKSDLTRVIGEFVAKRGTGDFPHHPAFGALTPRAWGVLTYRHIDHHLRQFGA